MFSSENFGVLHCVIGWNQLFSVVVFLAIFFISRQLIRNARLPPGPYGLPFIGYILFIDKTHRAAHMSRLCKQYKTDILSMTMFGHTAIILNTYDQIKNAFQKRTDLVDRMDMNIFSMFDPDYKGIINSSGHIWREHRRFSLYMMRDFGMGKIAAERSIQLESDLVSDVFRSHQGRPFDPLSAVNMAVANIICSIVFGKRFEYHDQEFQSALFNINELIRKFNNPALFFLLVTRLGQRLMADKYRQLVQHYEVFAAFVSKGIAEHRERYDGSVNDLIDGYLHEMEQGNCDTDVFNDKFMQHLITDLFLAGSETTFTTLRWALLYMSAYPDIQQKVHDELVSVVGPDRLPSMQDKRQTPYTEAVLSEVQRVNTLAPFGVSHTCLSADFELEGYALPRGTLVTANLHQVHRDPQTWKRPEEFYPENFLDDDGKVTNLDHLLPFSIGRRSCVGESLARMELYLFFASWMKTFRVIPETDQTVPNLVGVHTSVWQPVPFKIRMLERE